MGGNGLEITKTLSHPAWGGEKGDRQFEKKDSSQYKSENRDEKRKKGGGEEEES